MSKYRDRLRIIADILSVVNGRAKKTRIMYQANLSYRLLCRYLDKVMDAGLVRFEGDDCYVLTGKGKEYLDRHEEYSKRCENLENYVNQVNSKRTALQKMCFNASRTDGSLNLLNKNKVLKNQ